MAKNEEKVTEEVKAEEVTAEEPKKTGLYPQNTYIVHLPLTSDKQDDVTVGINGKYYKIRRGEDVEVPASVYEVLKNQEKMDTLAVRRRLAMSAEMNKKLKSM